MLKMIYTPASSAISFLGVADNFNGYDFCFFLKYRENGNKDSFVYLYNIEKDVFDKAVSLASEIRISLFFKSVFGDKKENLDGIIKDSEKIITSDFAFYLNQIDHYEKIEIDSKTISASFLILDDDLSGVVPLSFSHWFSDLAV